MLTKNDCLLLLSCMEETYPDEVKVLISELIKTGKPTNRVLRFINEHRQLDLTQFYEKIRKSYNQKKSNLYINIMKEVDEATEVLTTLASMALQILLFGRTATDKTMFYRNAKLADIYDVLHNYAVSGDIVPCNKLMRIIKADIKAMEEISRN